MEDENKTINIKINKNNEITAYATIGGMNGIDVPLEHYLIILKRILTLNIFYMLTAKLRQS